MDGRALQADVFRQAIELSPDAVVLFDNTGVVLYANQSCEAVLGWPVDEFIGSNLADLVHPDDIEIAIRSVAAITEQGVRSRPPTMMRFRRPDGSFAPGEMNGNPLTLEDGSIVQSLFLRRAEDQRLMNDAVERLAGGSSVEDLLAIVREHLLWRKDVSEASVAWSDSDGVRHGTGTVPSSLTGVDASDPASPWTRAWHGESVTGEVDELPGDVQPTARARGLTGFRIEPVEINGRVRALLTLWSKPDADPLPDIEFRLRTLKRLVMVMIRFTEQQDSLQYQAAHDALTGLANRRRFYEQVVAIATRPEATQTPAAVLYIDLDGFKPVNDRFGHAAGDRLLADVAARLTASCRSGDVVARLGGDEFAVLCRDCTVDDASAVAERFLAALDGPIDIGGQFVEVGASVGLAMGYEADGELLTLRADEALYDAKRGGGRRLVLG